MSETQENIEVIPDIIPVIKQDNVVEPKQEETIEIEVEDAEQEAQPEAKQEKAFDPKTDKVEFNTPEQQEKFNYMYKQVKMSDARNQMLNDMLQTQQKQLDDLRGRFSQTDAAEAERILVGKVKAARDAGDDAAEIAALGEWTDFKADKKISEKASQAKAPDPQLQHQAVQANIQYIEQFQNEKDGTGNLARPWLHDNHPEFESAISNLENIVQKYAGDPSALPKALNELDQVMRMQMSKKTPPQTRAPNPMQGGNLTNNKPKTTIKMTRQELDIAKKLGVDPKRYAAKRDELAGRK